MLKFPWLNQRLTMDLLPFELMSPASIQCTYYMVEGHTGPGFVNSMSVGLVFRLNWMLGRHCKLLI